MRILTIGFRRDSLRVVRFLSCVCLLVSTAPASAGFLEDLFGGSDAADMRSAPTPAPSARRAPASRSPSALRVNSSVRFNSSLRFNDDARGSARKKDMRAAEKREPGREQKVAAFKSPKPSFCAPGDVQPATDSSGARLRDATLRSGDSVVTARGILVFQGHVSCPHRDTDFVGLTVSKLPRHRRNVLLSLERTLHAFRAEQETRTEKETDVKIAGESPRQP
jgi:hypothetical protein